MNINDYLIDQAGKNWPDLLSGWSDLLPSTFTIWLVNRFGDVIFVADDGSVRMLDVGVGKVTQLANSREEFCKVVDEKNNADLWFLVSLTEACVAGGAVLAVNQCYGWKVPPLLGGKYQVDNVEPTDIGVHYGVLADIYRQTKDLPDGTNVRLVTIQDPEDNGN
jgi:hypothetical protein